MAYPKLRDLRWDRAPALAPAGELPEADTLSFLINKLSEARLLSLLDYPSS